MISALLPLWIICAPAVFIAIDGMTAPASSNYSGNRTHRADESRSVPPHRTTGVHPLGQPADHSTTRQAPAHPVSAA